MAKSRPKTAKACKAAGGNPVHFRGMARGTVACFGLSPRKKGSRRAKAKTATACKAAGGTPVHFKGMAKGEVACFGKGKSSSRKASRRGKAPRSRKQIAAAKRNIKKAQAARRSR